MLNTGIPRPLIPPSLNPLGLNDRTRLSRRNDHIAHVLGAEKPGTSSFEQRHALLIGMAV